MNPTPLAVIHWLFGPGPRPGPGRLWPRWLFLRALGLIFFSAFYSLLFQIRGLIGPEGILPAAWYLQTVAHSLGLLRYWFVPSLLWMGSGPLALSLLCWAGLAASVALILNLWPRGSVFVCLLTYLSFVSAAQDFSSYQSDGMLLAAGFLCLFFAPPGFRPRLGKSHPPSRASLFLLQWLWFRIYFESGLVKMASHDPHWRSLTALYDYYANGPLPNWIGWYAQQMPHAINAALALATLVIELGVVWMLFCPRRIRILCFFIVTPFQMGIILTANLAFLNHLVLALGILLLDDRFILGAVARLRKLSKRAAPEAMATVTAGKSGSGFGNSMETPPAHVSSTPGLGLALSSAWRHFTLVVTAFLLTWVFYVDTALLLGLMAPWLPLPGTPATALEPFRIANQYGLFAVMTTARYEIEFQGSQDGVRWEAYPFRYKPQNLRQAPRFYAPYQPRFDWNLWFASLATWRQYPFVVRTEILLLQNDASVLSLFAGNPFPGTPPRMVRAVIWQYWFTGLAAKRREGIWWRRKFLGLYAPEVELLPGGKVGILAMPGGGSPAPGRGDDDGGSP
ncbi:MAG: lipase maturation factor family protein [Terriglobia bacterium]